MPLAVEALRYFVGACAGLAVDWAVWVPIDLATGMPILAQAVSRTCGAFAAYLLMRGAFRAGGGPAGRQATRFAVAAAASWILSLLLVAVLASALGADLAGAARWRHFMAKVLSDGTTFAVNYFVMKLWVFAPDRAPDPPARTRI